MSDNPQYPDHFIERLHTIWGYGYLSPGGPQEVGEIMRDVDLTGKVVLDIGFGTGGPAITLVQDRGAAKVVGVDVEPLLAKRAQANVDAAGLAGKIELKIISPGPLPFEDDQFDVVFSKDSIIHVGDKPALFAEVFRVTKPGGKFAASDWLRGTGAKVEALLVEYTGQGHLAFEMATAAQMEAVLRDAGFTDVSSRDRNEWYIGQSEKEYQQVSGPLYQELVEKVGREFVDPWVETRRLGAKCAKGGALRPTHLFGTKPEV